MGLFFEEIRAKVSERDIELTLSDAATALIAKAGFDPVYGARPLKRALYEIVEDRLADLILEGRRITSYNVCYTKLLRNVYLYVLYEDDSF